MTRRVRVVVEEMLAKGLDRIEYGNNQGLLEENYLGIPTESLSFLSSRYEWLSEIISLCEDMLINWGD